MYSRKIDGLIIWCKGCLDNGVEGLNARILDSDLQFYGLTSDYSLPNGVEFEAHCANCGGMEFVLNVIIAEYGKEV